MRRTGSALLIALAFAFPALAHNCVLNKIEVNPDNGSTTAGQTGVMRCYDEDGKLLREQELRNGEFIGLERFHDDDGSVRERQINANHNTQGLARDLYPDGSVARAGTYEDGDAIGVVRSFHPGGRLKALWFHEKAGERAVVSLGFDLDGRILDMSCGERSFVPEDSEICGFGGKPVTTTLYAARGQPRQRVTHQSGQRIVAEDLAADGSVERRYAIAGTTVTSQEFFPHGGLKSEQRSEDGFVVSARHYYMNGKLSTNTTLEPGSEGVRTVVESFRDTGVRATREEYAEARRVRADHYDEQGRPTEELIYAGAGHLDTRRKFAPDGTVMLSESYYEDGSRKSSN